MRKAWLIAALTPAATRPEISATQSTGAGSSSELFGKFIIGKIVVETTLAGKLIDDPAAAAVLKKFIPTAWTNDMF